MIGHQICRWLLLTAALPLAGCDAWPTQVVNKTSSAIEFKYRHKDYGYWSAFTTLKSGESIRLDRGNYVDDFLGIAFREGQNTFVISPQNLRNFQRICARSMLEHIANLGGDCDIIYFGMGHTIVMRVP